MILLALSLICFFNSPVQAYNDIENLLSRSKPNPVKKKQENIQVGKAYLIHKALHDGLGFGTGFVLAKDLQGALSHDQGETSLSIMESKPGINLQIKKETPLYDTVIPTAKLETKEINHYFVLASDSGDSSIDFCD